MDGINDFEVNQNINYDELLRNLNVRTLQDDSSALDSRMI